MSSTRILNAFARNCLLPGKNGMCSQSVISPSVRRAFAVVPLRMASSLSSSQHLYGRTQAISQSNSSLCKVEGRLQGVPVRHSSSGDHVNLWKAERVVTVVMLGAFPCTAMFPSPAMETVLAFCLIMHSHWGIEALVTDYIRPSVFGNVIPKLSQAAVTFLSMVAFGGLCYFIYADVGLVNAVKMLWNL